MARPHVEFVQSQVLPFTQGLYGGSRPDVEMRILSMDNEGGDASTMIRWPAGWARTESEHLDCDEEFLVLEGSLEINGKLYRKHDYAHLPSGYLRTNQLCARGAVTISFFSSGPHVIQSESAGNGFDATRLVEHIETRTFKTMTDVAESFDTPDWDPTGTFHKLLYQDPYTGERTWMIAGSFAMVDTFGDRRVFSTVLLQHGAAHFTWCAARVDRLRPSGLRVTHRTGIPITTQCCRLSMRLMSKLA